LETIIDRELLHRGKPQANVPDELKPYLGTYYANFAHYKNAPFKVVFQNGRLAVDIPDQLIFELKDPDKDGRRAFVISDQVTVAFQKDAAGKAKMGTKLYSDKAIEKVDEYTIRLNGQTAQLAIPENLFHYPAVILHPKDNGVLGVGSIGTGAFTLTEFELGKKAVLKRRDGYWGKAAALDEVQFIDNGDDPAAAIAALASGQVDGMMEASTSQYAALQKIPNVVIHQVTTGQTGVARMQEDKEIFKDPRIRKAMRLAIDCRKVLQIAHLVSVRRPNITTWRRCIRNTTSCPSCSRTSPRPRSCWLRPASPMASIARSSARRTPIGKPSPSVPWSTCGSRSAST